ncbi:holdfast anchor protein HfaD [Oceanicaulis alexandrii]|uniref:holdfast anchor protein HfaD n=1 Tax=Oceanicaulis alexandrii TaxID=153233 RepID=UPI0035CFC352
MSRLARVLIAGTSAATLISAASFAEPINKVELDQDQTGPVLSEDNQSADGVRDMISTAVAQGNSGTGALSGDSEISGLQNLDGSVSASSLLSANGVWASVISTATAQGNALTAGVETGALGMDLEQTAQAGQVNALSRLRISDYAAHSVQTASSAVNAIQTSAVGGQTLSIRQSSAADSSAEARVEAAGAEIETSVVGAVAAGNSLLSTAEDEESVLTLDQSQSGSTTSTAYAEIGNADYGVTAASQAAGNTATFQNDYGDSQVGGVQSNSGEVRSDTVILAGEFANGYATGSANAVGNSVLTSTIGANTYSGVQQTNSGDVIANVSMVGGYDGGSGAGLGSVLNATAIGNAQSAYVCATCPVGVTGEINQINSGAVSASAVTVQNGQVRTLTSSATAVGNAATFATQTRGN